MSGIAVISRAGSAKPSGSGRASGALRFVVAAAAALLAGAAFSQEHESAEAELLELIRQESAYTLVPEPLFMRLGWELPDDGALVRALAEAAPGSAFDPLALESLPAERLGYSAAWHVVRYPYYGLDWDITGLELTPVAAEPGLPTLAIVHGGSANWYEFFVDPHNGPGLGQYLAQRAPVLLITIPGNFRYGGWLDANADRAPAYLLDTELPRSEVELRNALFTFSLIADGVERLIREATQGPVLLVGHSTGGELQFLLKERLRDRLHDLTLGWGTGGPAVLRREWELEQGGISRSYRSILAVRGRDPEGYLGSRYLGPLNPLGPGADLPTARAWFDAESRRRPQFKQPLQDLEHRAEIEHRERAERELRAAAAAVDQRIDVEAAVADLFSTMTPPLEGYDGMVWTTAAGDDGHWNADPELSRELDVANRFRQRNPDAFIRVVVFDLPMSHYGHIERPRQLAGGLVAAAKVLLSAN